MATMIKQGWSKPSNLLFATEIPVNEKAFAFALEQARLFDSSLVLFHAYDTLVVAASETSGIRYYDYTAAARTETEQLEPLAQQAIDAGIDCRIIVRPGLPADQLLAYMRTNPVDRVIMSTHSRRGLGEILMGSVAESIIRTSPVPIFVIGPDAVNGNFRNFATRTVLCAVYEPDHSACVTALAAEVACQHKARLILEHVLRPHDRRSILGNQTLEQQEKALLALVPLELRNRIPIETVIVPGQPADELLYQSRIQQADLIVMGTHQTSMLAAVARPGVLHRVLAHAQCPVLAISSFVAQESSVRREKYRLVEETFMAGVF